MLGGQHGHTALHHTELQSSMAPTGPWHWAEGLETHPGTQDLLTKMGFLLTMGILPRFRAKELPYVFSPQIQQVTFLYMFSKRL